jgi:hypothetical protein
MKRFLCRKCGRIVRVRRLPADFAPNTEAHEANAHHVGTCAHHDAQGASRKRINDRGRVHETRIKRVAVSTPPKAKKGKQS